MALQLSQDADADALLDRDPLALLIGMLLDQQIPMEHAFWAPAELARRLGTDPLDARAIAEHDPEALVALFATPRALHRYPKSMAGRVQALCAALVGTYDGDVTLVWRDVADGGELVARLLALPGFGKQKAQIFTALLGKQRGVTPPGWRDAAGSYGDEGAFRSVADVVDPASLLKVREFKQAAKAAARAGEVAPVHRVQVERRTGRMIDPDQVCDATAVLADIAAVERCAAVLDALGDPHRLGLLLALHHAGDLCVSDLAFAVGMTDSAVSHALRLLRAHGMVTAHREGRLVRYRVTGDLTRRLLDVVSGDVVGDVTLHADGDGHAS